MDIVTLYVRFCFDEYELNPYGWITKNPPSIAEFREQLWLREQSHPDKMLFGRGPKWSVKN